MYGRAWCHAPELPDLGFSSWRKFSRIEKRSWGQRSRAVLSMSMACSLTSACRRTGLSQSSAKIV